MNIQGQGEDREVEKQAQGVWSRRFTRNLLIALIGAGFFLLFANPFIGVSVWEPWDYLHDDFPMFYGASKSLVAGESPYSVDILDAIPDAGSARGWGSYIYPPLFAWVLVPFSFLPIEWAKHVYVILCLFIYLIFLTPRRSKDFVGALEGVVSLAVLCLWGPIVETCRFGQSNFLPLFLFFAAWKILEGAPDLSSNEKTRIREIVAGILIGVGSMVKLTPFVILPIFLVAGRYRLVVGCIAGSVLTATLTGLGSNFEYFTRVLPTLGNFSDLSHFHSITRVVLGLANDAGVGQEIDPQSVERGRQLGLMLSGLLYVLFLIFVHLNRKKLKSHEILLLSCFLPCLLFGAWYHHYTLVLLPVLYSLSRLIRLAIPSGNGHLRIWPILGLSILFLLLLPNTFYVHMGKIFYAWTFTQLRVYNPTWLVVSNLCAFFLLCALFNFRPFQKPNASREKA